MKSASASIIGGLAAHVEAGRLREVVVKDRPCPLASEPAGTRSQMVARRENTEGLVELPDPRCFPMTLLIISVSSIATPGRRFAWRVLRVRAAGVLLSFA